MTRRPGTIPRRSGPCGRDYGSAPDYLSLHRCAWHRLISRFYHVCFWNIEHGFINWQPQLHRQFHFTVCPVAFTIQPQNRITTPQPFKVVLVPEVDVIMRNDEMPEVREMRTECHVPQNGRDIIRFENGEPHILRNVTFCVWSSDVDFHPFHFSPRFHVAHRLIMRRFLLAGPLRVEPQKTSCTPCILPACLVTEARLPHNAGI